MKLFEITQTEQQLVLTKRQASQLVRGLLAGAVVVFVGSGLWGMLQEQLNLNSIVTLIICSLLFFIVMRRAVPQFLALVSGEKWTFDLGRGVVERNDKFLGTLSQLCSVRAWEDDGERRLDIQFTGGKPFIIGDALTNSEWDELVSTAQHISAFTNIKLVDE